MKGFVINALAILLLFACQSKEAVSQRSSPILTPDTIRSYRYPWLQGYDIKDKLINRLPVPEGYLRINLDPLSFGAWLRNLPLKEGQPLVYLFDGRKKPNQKAQFALLDIDTGEKDLQQCADAVMRLRGEYLYSRNQYDSIRFTFTNGFQCDFKRWSQGYRPVVSGNDVSWSKREPPAHHYETFKKYLERIFMYCGTHSLSREMKAKDMHAIQPGDVFIQGGFPGHAVIVMDVAEHPSTRERLFLLAQSYMPAQDMHLLRNPTDPSLSPWYSSTTDRIVTPEWTFQRSDLKHF